jgi:hypothetical protein
MKTQGPESDGAIRAEVDRLRFELRALELRMMTRNLNLARLWIFAIFLASLALSAAVFGPLLAKP